MPVVKACIYRRPWPYPISQFNIEGFGTPLRLDRNKYGGGVIIYIREHLPCKLMQFYNKPKDIEAIFFELTLEKQEMDYHGCI